MPYTKQWSAANPGCLILLLDRSTSMNDKFGGKSLAAGEKLKDQVAVVVNNTIGKLANASRKETEIRPRVEVAVIGYGAGGVASALPSSLTGKDLVPISDLFASAVRVEKKTQPVYHKELGETEMREIEFPIWVEPMGDGGTPMCEALRKATDIAALWAAQHPNNYPPVIINITDGEAGDGDPRVPAQALMAIETKDGTALLFNCHISAQPSGEVLYPAASSDLPSNHFADMLYSMSSQLPDQMRLLAVEKGLDVRTGSRGFVFNADASDIVNMVTIATTPGAGLADR
jgi:uncharacterized protein YegL